MEMLLFALGWLPLLAALAALAGSYVHARRRAFHQPRDLSNERTDRVWNSAGLFAGAVVVPIAVSLFLLGAPGVLLLTLMAASIFGLAGLVLTIAIDLVVAKPFEAKRTPGWMIAAPCLFVAVFLALLLLPLLALIGGGGAALLGLGPLAILAAAAAAGLVWWAYLPLDQADLRRTFE